MGPIQRMLLWLASCLLLFNLPAASPAATIVFVDFGTPGSDFDAAVEIASPGLFSAPDKADIKTTIVSQLGTIYSDWDISFTTTDPGGSRDKLDMYEALNPDTTPASPGLLGWAPFDWYNLSGHNEANVITKNFSSFTSGLDDAAKSTATLKLELATALAGTAAHELGHTFGLDHQDSYGTPGITPATYGATGGLQDLHIMATGSTGLSETERETIRTLSKYSQAKLEITGSGGSPVKLKDSAVFAPISEIGAPHSIPPTAQDITPGFLPLTVPDTLAMRLHGASIGPIATPGDLYKLIVPTDGFLTAEVLSLKWYVNSIETVLTLFASDGFTVILSQNGSNFGPDVYSSGTGENDPLMINVPITAGTYFLEVLSDPLPSATTPDPGPPGGFYDLFVVLDLEAEVESVPEPSSFALGAIGILGMLSLGWRRRRCGR